MNLPGVLPQGAVFTVTVSYAGRIEPQSLEQEVDRDRGRRSRTIGPTWSRNQPAVQQPQLLVPADVGERLRDGHDPPDAAARRSAPCARATRRAARRSRSRLRRASRARCSCSRRRNRYRYLACAVARLVPVETRTLTVQESAVARCTRGRRPLPGADAHGVCHAAAAWTRARNCWSAREDIAGVYAGILHDVPYPGFTLAVLESYVPGGHSPAYFAALNQPLPTSPFSWRDDPASFDNYPEFFLAHELAHQWWGQAVGWKNYHEQWLSEGFAQYFAAIYAERREARRVRRHHPVDEPMGRGDVRPGPGLSRIPAGAHQERRPHPARGRLQQGRDGAAHAPAAGGRRGVLPRRCGGSTTATASRRQGPTSCAGCSRPSRACRCRASSRSGSTGPTCPPWR